MWDNIWKLIQNTINNLGTMLDVISDINGLPSWLFFVTPGLIASCIASVTAVGVAKLLLGWGNV